MREIQCLIQLTSLYVSIALEKKFLPKIGVKHASQLLYNLETNIMAFSISVT